MGCSGATVGATVGASTQERVRTPGVGDVAASAIGCVALATKLPGGNLPNLRYRTVSIILSHVTFNAISRAYVTVVMC